MTKQGGGRNTTTSVSSPASCSTTREHTDTQTQIPTHTHTYTHIPESRLPFPPALCLSWPFLCLRNGRLLPPHSSPSPIPQRLCLWLRTHTTALLETSHTGALYHHPSTHPPTNLPTCLPAWLPAYHNSRSACSHPIPRCAASLPRQQRWHPRLVSPRLASRHLPCCLPLGAPSCRSFPTRPNRFNAPQRSAPLRTRYTAIAGARHCTATRSSAAVEVSDSCMQSDCAWQQQRHITVAC